MNYDKLQQNKEEIKKLRDIKFLTEIAVFADINFMLILWAPLVEVPLALLLIVFAGLQGKKIKKLEARLMA